MDAIYSRLAPSLPHQNWWCPPQRKKNEPLFAQSVKQSSIFAVLGKNMIPPPPSWVMPHRGHGGNVLHEKSSKVWPWCLKRSYTENRTHRGPICKEFLESLSRHRIFSSTPKIHSHSKPVESYKVFDHPNGISFLCVQFIMDDTSLSSFPTLNLLGSPQWYIKKQCPPQQI